MNNAIARLAAFQAAAGILILVAGPAAAPVTWDVAPKVAGLVALFALVGLVPIHLEFRRNAFSVVLDEAVWVFALFAVGPLWAVGAAVAGDAACRFVRQPLIKSAYNLASMLLAGSIGGTVFSAFDHSDHGDPQTWLVAVAAVAALAACSLVSISVVVSMVEGRPLRQLLVASAPAQVVATITNASLGLAAVVLFDISPFGPLMLLPVVGATLAGSRSQALQAAQNLRFDRLYAAASRTGGLTSRDEALAALAGEARGLLTGTAGVCLVDEGSGRWSGVLVDDHGTGPLDGDIIALLVALVAPGEARALSRTELLKAGHPNPPGGALVLAAPAATGKGRLVLGVWRKLAPDDQAGARVEVLGAFAGYAALVAENALLYEDVEDALERQIDLNRQKSEFVAAVSHELRTPLTTVIAAIASVRRLQGRIEPATQDEILARALRQGEGLRHLIDDLLVVAAAEHRSQAPRARTTDVAGLLDDVAAECGAGLRLRVEAAAGVGAVLTDDDKLRRIVSNLVDNALKYAAESTVELRAHRSATHVEVSVTDHGPGIPATDRERVFEPFVQLDPSSTRKRGGTGLGLHLCRQLAVSIGSQLTLEDTPGGGCRFVVRVPATAMS